METWYSVTSYLSFLECRTGGESTAYCSHSNSDLLLISATNHPGQQAGMMAHHRFRNLGTINIFNAVHGYICCRGYSRSCKTNGSLLLSQTKPFMVIYTTYISLADLQWLLHHISLHSRGLTVSPLPLTFEDSEASGSIIHIHCFELI